jgi:hypothetical protein
MKWSRKKIVTAALYIAAVGRARTYRAARVAAGGFPETRWRTVSTLLIARITF